MPNNTQLEVQNFLKCGKAVLHWLWKICHFFQFKKKPIILKG